MRNRSSKINQLEVTPEQEAEYRTTAEHARLEITAFIYAEVAEKLRPLAALADEYGELAERTGNGDLAALVFRLRIAADLDGGVR